MGQKSNINTLRKFQTKLNLLSYNSKNFLVVFKFLEYLKFLLATKGVWVVLETINFTGSKLFLNFTFFFRSFKTAKYLKKGLKTKSIGSFSLKKKYSKLKQLFLGVFQKFKNNFLILSIKNINKEIHRKLLHFFYNKLKKFVNILFSRRFNFFIDFLKVVTLLCQNKVDSNIFIKVLGQIFKYLTKRSHSKFLMFVSYLFKIMISELYFLKTKNIQGIKFSLSGRIKGKPRASTAFIREGISPLQSFNKNINFSKMHVYTLMGSFGLKLWLVIK